VLTLLVLPGALAAHPMGNFSISHHSTIHVSSASISIKTIFDFAEIAAFQMFPDPRKAAEHAAEWVSHLHLQAGGRTLPLQLQKVRSEIIPASSGLPTLRVQLETAAPWNGGDVALSFRDENYSSRIGWKEVVVEADPSIKLPDGNAYAIDRSHGLTVYPEDLLSSPPDVVSANLRVITEVRKEPITPMLRKILLVAVIVLLVAAPFIGQLSSCSRRATARRL
jgi:nickel/cobalt exporter